MLKKLNNNYYLAVTSIILIFLFGSYISISRGSNLTDGDSYSLILSFLDLLDFGKYYPSRGAYGHLIPEMLLGSAAYFFGIPISNLISFIFFFSSIYIIFITFFEKNITNFSLFLLLISSNFYLLFENTNTIDYPIALFFLSVGLFFLKNDRLTYASIFFAITISCRANFCIFVYPLIFLYFLHNKIILKKIKLFLFTLTLTTIIGLLFFIPVFYVNNFSLNFINIPFITNSNTPGWYGGPPISFGDLFPRFIFKIYKLIGSFSFMIIFVVFLYNIKKLISLKTINQKFIWSIIILNLLIYALTPTKFLIVNPFIIFLYVLLFAYLNKKIIYIIILLNMIPWFINYEFLNIKYLNDNFCDAREALSASFQFSISQGHFLSYLSHPSYADCYSQNMREYANNFINNKPLKLSN